MKKLKSIIRYVVFALYKIANVKFPLTYWGIKIGNQVKLVSSIIIGGIQLGDRVALSHSTLYGDIILENDVLVSKSQLNEKVLVRNHTQILRSYLKGTFDINSNCILDNVNFNGVLSLSDHCKILNLIGEGKILAGRKIKINGGSVVLNGCIEIGDYTTINGPNTDIYSAVNMVKIGKFCSIARNVSIQEYNHKMDKVSTYFINYNIFGRDDDESNDSKGSIIIENDVWIGTQCVILSGAHISNGAVVAANSVVTGFIPPYAVVAGSPARVIKYRFPEETIAKLLEIRWWDWSEEKLLKNRKFFIEPNVNFNLIV